MGVPPTGNGAPTDPELLVRARPTAAPNRYDADRETDRGRNRAAADSCQQFVAWQSAVTVLRAMAGWWPDGGQAMCPIATVLPKVRQGTDQGGHMRLRHTLRAIGVVVVLATGGVIALASPAAAAGCGSSCDDQSPYHTFYDATTDTPYTCANDAVTLASIQAGGQTVELRYSARCGSAWARSNGITYTIRVERDSPSRLELAYAPSGGGDYYTRMVNTAGTRHARACYKQTSSTVWNCTAYKA